jgi:hypothetical protein
VGLCRLAKETKLPEVVFRSIEIFGNGPAMPSPDVLEPPSGLSFGDLLDWHLRRGTRPPGSDRQGEPWKKATFAGDVGVSDKASQKLDCQQKPAQRHHHD